MNRSLLLLLALSGSVTNCKSKVGDVCRCASDCKNGLVCLVGDRIELECLDPKSSAGECVQDEDIIAESDDGDSEDDSIYLDMWTKRDLGPDTPAEESGSGSSSETEGTSETSATSESTGSTASTTSDDSNTSTDSSTESNTSAETSTTDNTSSTNGTMGTTETSSSGETGEDSTSTSSEEGPSSDLSNSTEASTGIGRDIESFQQ